MINPFIGATQQVISTMAFTEATAGKPYLKKDNVARGDISGVIVLSGSAQGIIAVTFSKECILEIVSAMFGEKMEALNDEVRDAVGEIANMISGQARQKLETMDTNLKAAIPTVLAGQNHIINFADGKPIIAVPFTTPHGQFTVEVCLF